MFNFFSKKFLTKHSAGFTILELMVVISIIAILSSTALSALATARLKSRDTAVKEAVRQFRTLLEQEFNETGSYAGIQTNTWFVDSSSCRGIFTSVTYGLQARKVCNTIITNSSSNSVSGASGMMWLGTAKNDQTKYYSIMAYLPSKGTFYCIGNNGKNSDTSTGAWTEGGCYGDTSL